MMKSTVECSEPLGREPSNGLTCHPCHVVGEHNFQRRTRTNHASFVSWCSGVRKSRDGLYLSNNGGVKTIAAT